MRPHGWALNKDVVDEVPPLYSQRTDHGARFLMAALGARRSQRPFVNARVKAKWHSMTCLTVAGQFVANYTNVFRDCQTTVSNFMLALALCYNRHVLC